MSVEKLNELKVRIFDLQETLTARNEFENQFFGSLASILEIPADQQQDPQVYINAIVAMKAKIPAPVEPDHGVEAE